jgi:hypothetical protein
MSGWCFRRINKHRHVPLISINPTSPEAEAIFSQRTSTQFRKELIGIGAAVARSPLPHHQDLRVRIRFSKLSPQGP